MDTLTHALSGALLARATAPKMPGDAQLTTRERVLIGALAAAFPDLDFIVSYLSPLAYLYHHRGVTHSLLLLPLWAALLAWACAAAIKRDPKRWRSYVGVIALGIAVHILGDLITSFGTIVFAPLTDARYAWSTTFIIDLFFSGIILLGLIASVLWRASRIPAVVACGMLLGYVGFQYLLQQRAIEFGERHAQGLKLKEATVSALPRPVSPFNWMIVIAEADRYHYTSVNLSRAEPPAPLPENAGWIQRLAAPYLPLSDAQWITEPRYGSRDVESFAREAWNHPQFGFYRWFAAYPALFRAELRDSVQCAWFQDLRFQTPGRSTVPFRYGMCRAATGKWQAFEWQADGRVSVVY